MLQLLTNSIYEELSNPIDQPAASDGASDYDKIKKYIMFVKLTDLKFNLVQYINHNSTNASSNSELTEVVYFITVVLNFFDLFDYKTVRELSKEILDATVPLFKANKLQKNKPNDGNQSKSDSVSTGKKEQLKDAATV